MFRIRCYLLALAVISSFSHVIAQQELSREQLIASYVYKFAENIKWPDNPDLQQEFVIQVIGGNDQTRINFDAMADERKVSGKRLQISYSQEYKSTDSPNMVYVVGEKEQFVEKLMELIKGSYILLITENYPDKDQIMINFVDQAEGSKLNFELNYMNIIAQGLEVSPDLIILGGDQVGLLELFEKTKEELESKNQSISKLQANIDLLGSQIEDKSEQIESQQELMARQQMTIDRQKEEIALRESILQDKQQESQELLADIEKQQGELARKQRILLVQAENLSSMKQEIALGERNLERQLGRTDSLNTVIDKQIGQVGKLSDELNRNRQFVILLSVSLSLGVALIIVILLAYRNIRKTNKELEIQKTNLIHAEKMASIGTLAAGVAHELNNPLNVVAGSLHFFENSIQKVLKDGADLNQEDKEDMITLLNDSRSSVKRALQIISGLNMSVSGKSTPSRIELSEIIENVLALFRTKLDDDINFELHIRKVEVECFPDRIHYLLSSILDNAIKALSECNIPEKKVTLRAFQRQKEAVIEISNNGPSIPGRIMEKIYDPFFTTREPGSGNGLGLYNSYNIVKQHQGSIEVENTENAVSFKICLPLELKGYEALISPKENPPK